MDLKKVAEIYRYEFDHTQGNAEARNYFAVGVIMDCYREKGSHLRRREAEQIVLRALARYPRETQEQTHDPRPE